MHVLLLRQGWAGGQRIGLGDAAVGVVGLGLSWDSLSESLGDRVLLASGAPSCYQGRRCSPRCGWVGVFPPIGRSPFPVPLLRAYCP